MRITSDSISSTAMRERAANGQTCWKTLACSRRNPRNHADNSKLASGDLNLGGVIQWMNPTHGRIKNPLVGFFPSLGILQVICGCRSTRGFILRLPAPSYQGFLFFELAALSKHVFAFPRETQQAVSNHDRHPAGNTSCRSTTPFLHSLSSHSMSFS